jgi:hypothetical protein
MRTASRSATAGPAITRNIDATMKTASAIVRAVAIVRVFHHGRDSVTSYAAFSVVMIETIAPELDQMVTKNPNVRIPPLFCFDSDAIAVVMISITDCGATRDSIRTTSPISVCSGKKLATAITNSSAGNNAKKK